MNWTRSRIRRQHLITLGIPVNLDEVLPRAGTKLPTLEIHTRPTSAPPAPYTAKQLVSSSRAGTPRSGTPQPGVKSTALATAQMRLGPKPELDEAKISSLLNLDTGQSIIKAISLVADMLYFRQPALVTCYNFRSPLKRPEGADSTDFCVAYVFAATEGRSTTGF